MSNALFFMLVLAFALPRCNSSSINLKRSSSDENKSSPSPSSEPDNFDPNALCKQYQVLCPQATPPPQTEFPSPSPGPDTSVLYFSSGVKASSSSAPPFSMDIGYFRSGPINDWGKNFSFQCPQHSFLVGIGGDFDSNGSTNDRRYKFGCEFLRNRADKEMLKGTCRKLAPTANAADFSVQCPEGSYFAGVDSNYDTTLHARNFEFHCCELLDPQKSPIKIKKGTFYDFQKDQDGTVTGNRCSNAVSMRSISYGAVDVESYKASKQDGSNFLVQLYSYNESVNQRSVPFFYDGRMDGYFREYFSLAPVRVFEASEHMKNYSLELLQNVLMNSIQATYIFDKDLGDLIFSIRNCELTIAKP